MTHPDRVEDYLEHIVSAIQRCSRYVGKSGSLEAREQDEQAQDAIIRTIAVIGEAAGRIQKMAPEFVAGHPEIPWSKMRGIWNKVVHDYFDVAWDVVWNTVQDDFPPLLEQISTLMRPDDAK